MVDLASSTSRGTSSVTSEVLGFAISVCRLRERGRMSKSVYVRVFRDLELLTLFVVRLDDSFNFPLG